MKTEHIETIDEVVKLINKYSQISGLIFRGQSTGSWMLKQSIFRCNEKYVAVADHLEKFKKYSIGRIDDIEKYSNKELWAIGQHFGLKTPLLDWSISAAIALYFAFEQNAENGEEYASLYSLNAKEVNREYCRRIYSKYQIATHNLIPGLSNLSNESTGKILIENFETNPDSDEHSVESDVESSLFRIFSPKRFNNPRIVAQRGLFTFSQSGKPIEEILQLNGMTDLIEKNLINTKLKPDIVKYLDIHNINQMSLYPDITGAALYANTKIYRYDSEAAKEHKTDFWL